MFQRTVSCALVFSIAILSSLTVQNTADAKPFKRVKEMELKYAWGTCSLQEFDDFDAAYPSYLPIADITFFPNGTFDAYDRQSGSFGGGSYTRQGPNIVITIGTQSQFGVVEYVGSKVAPRQYAGEILVNGVVWGHWRGEII